MTPIPARVNLVSIFCRDHVRLADWYRSAFGWPEIDAVRSPIFRALDAGSVALGFHHDDAYDLLGLDDERGAVGTRIHLTLDVGTEAAVDAAEALLVAAGAAIRKAPFTTYYQARQIVFTDPEGNVMRLSSAQVDLGR